MIVLENKIKIADIVNRNKGIKNYFLLDEYNKKFDENKEKFYDENKDKEPLKSKIQQLKHFFRKRRYGIGYYQPKDEEIDLAKELCQIMTGISFPTELYTDKSNQDKDNYTFNIIVTNIGRQLQRAHWIQKRNPNVALVLTDDEIKTIIINLPLPLPSFETEFQKQFNITKPNPQEINYSSQKYDKYDLKKILDARDFILYLHKNEVDKLLGNELDLDFILENNIHLCDSNSFGLDNVEIENMLFNHLKSNTLNKFDTAEQILNFYYKKLKLVNNNFDPSFRFAYRMLKLYDKKLAEANSQNYANKFKQLCECAKECTKDILGKNPNVIQSVKNIFSYVNMFETHRTSEFNLNLGFIKQDIVNISTFMKEHLLIGKYQTNMIIECQADSNLEVTELNLSVSKKEWLKEFFIFLFTHFLTLCDSDFKIEKSAQLRKLVNFLQTMNTNEISEDQTNYQKYVDNNIKYVYETTNRFKAFRHLHTVLPDEIPKQEGNQNNLLLE